MNKQRKNNDQPLFPLNKSQSIMAFLKNNSDQFYTASKINKTLGIKPEDDHHDLETHTLLLELSKAGVVSQKKGHGFKYVAFEDRKAV